MRTTTVLLMVFFLALTGCTDRKEQEELLKKNAELKNELAARDHFIDEVTATINEIHDALEVTMAKEKNVVRETTKPEGKAAQTPLQMKQQILTRISDMHSTIMESKKKIAALQRKLDEAGVQFAGLQKMVDDLKTQLEAREQSILQLQASVESLKGEVREKVAVIAAREQTIDEQTRELNKVYFVAGTKDELRQKGIITKEGGFPFGLFGSTIALGTKFNPADFRGLDKTKDMTIEYTGVVEEIVPKRDTSWYKISQLQGGKGMLRITDPSNFWKQNRVVIVTE